MFGIKDKTAGFFIEIENIFSQIQDSETEIADREKLAIDFLVLLLGIEKVSKITQSEVVEITESYINEVAELKSNYEWVYDPPQLPTSSEESENTIGDEYRKEFSQIYGGYVEMIYLLATTFSETPLKILEWPTIDFLFWSNYLLHKKAVENIK